jgi:transcriptional regulator with XRE-family HTH domain
MATRPQHFQVYQPVPAFLRTMRERAGLTQRQLAARIHKSQPWVQKSEVGSRRVDVAEFALFCRGCGIDPGRAIRQLSP